MQQTRLHPYEYIRVASQFPQKSPSSFDFVVEGDVDLTGGEAGRWVVTLPKAEIRGSVKADGRCALLEIQGCRVSGDLSLRGSMVRHVENGCVVFGQADMSACPQVSRVEGDFRGDVSLSRSSIREVGAGLRVGGNLFLDGCKNLETVDCQVGGALDASHSGLAFVGGNCFVGGDVYLSHCKRLSKVGYMGSVKNAVFDGSGIQELEGSFRCTESLAMRDCRGLKKVGRVTVPVMHIDSCPASDICFEGVSHHLLVENCPNIRKVAGAPSGSVRIENCSIESLADLGGMGGHLVVSNCHAISEIGGHWGGAVDLRSMNGLKQIREDFTCQGDLSVHSCPALEGVGGVVGGDGQFWDAGGRVVFKQTYSSARGLLFQSGEGGSVFLGGRVGGGLRVSDSHLDGVSRSFQVKEDATFSRCTGKVYIRGYFGGRVSIHECETVALGADFECDGALVLLDCRDLKVVNCSVGGKAVISSESLVRVGPAFLGKKDAEFFGCVNLRSFRGFVEGEVRTDGRCGSRVHYPRPDLKMALSAS